MGGWMDGLKEQLVHIGADIGNAQGMHRVYMCPPQTSTLCLGNGQEECWCPTEKCRWHFRAQYLATEGPPCHLSHLQMVLGIESAQSFARVAKHRPSDR